MEKSNVTVNPDIIIIGGGPAGLAAALAAREAGVQDILILEREAQVGNLVAENPNHRFAEVALRGGCEIKRLERLVKPMVELLVAAGEDAVYPLPVQHSPHDCTYYATDRLRVCNLPQNGGFQDGCGD